MNELLTAIFARYTASTGDALRALLTGGMWLNVIPSPQQYPAIRVWIPEAGTGFTFEGSHDVIRVTFSIFTTDTKEADVDTDPQGDALAIRAALIALYEDVTLTLTNSKNQVYVFRRGGVLLPDPDGGYVCHVEFEYRVG